MKVLKSTLDEVKESDILLHVVDIAHPQFEDQIRTVNKTLQDLESFEKPTIMVFNKIDLYRSRYFDQYVDKETKDSILGELKENLESTFDAKSIFVSATKKENIDKLRDDLKKMIVEAYEVRYPYQKKTW